MNLGLFVFFIAASALSATPNLLSNVPARFEPAGEGFVSRNPGYGLFVGPRSTTVAIGRSKVEIRFPDARSAKLEAIDPLPGRSHYLVGNRTDWRRNVPQYGRVRYRGLYEGIDLVFHGNGSKLEYDVVVAPAADPSQIAMSIAGASSVDLLSSGALRIRTADGELTMEPPVSFQTIDGRRVPVASSFTALKNGDFGFRLGPWDHARELIIDPVLSLASFLGGNVNDAATAIAADAAGNIYVTGYTVSADYPVAGNPFRSSSSGGRDVFVSKLSPGGNQLLFSTYIGGDGDDTPVGIVADAFGNVTIGGNTSSANYPAGSSALQAGGSGMFLSRISADGSQLLASTFFGGEPAGDGLMAALAREPGGNLVITGYTSADDFPITASAFQRTKRLDGDAFVAKISGDLTTLLFSSFLGGDGADQGRAIAADAQGNIYIAGQTGSANFPAGAGSFASTNRGATDAFVAKISANGNTLLGTAVLGGTEGDFGMAVAAGPGGHAYVAGLTYSGSYPTTSGVFQFLRPPTATSAFVSKISPDFTSLAYSTYFGSTGAYFDARGIAGVHVDASDNVYLTGYGLGAGLPVTAGALQSPSPGAQDGFVARLGPAGDILNYSTFLGGVGDEFLHASTIDASNNVYIAGSTASANFPVSVGAYQAIYKANTDAFVAKIDFGTAVNPCSYALSASSATFDSNSGAGTFNVTTGSGCTWTATSSQTWTVVTSGASGTGNGTVNFTVDINATTASRTAQIRVGSLTFNITQTSQPCLLTIDPQNRSMPASGGLVNFVVTGIAGCTWTAASNSAWMRLPGTASGTGTGAVPVTIDANMDAIPRTGSLTIARQWVQIVQPSPNPAQAFDDVAISHLFADHIFLMKYNAISDTCNNANQFCPESNTTRAQMALFIIRKLMNGDNFTYTQTPFFSDVPRDHPQFAHIQKMRDLGITSGCTTTTYCPNDSVTRGQMAAFIIRARLGIRAGQTFTFPTTQSFTDVPSSDLFYSFIQKMKEFGITSGCTASEYCPGGFTTRGQMSVFVIRALATP